MNDLEKYIIGDNQEVDENEKVILYFDSKNFCQSYLKLIRFYRLNSINPLCDKNTLLKCFFKNSEELFYKMAKGEFNPNYDEETLAMINKFNEIDKSAFSIANGR